MRLLEKTTVYQYHGPGEQLVIFYRIPFPPVSAPGRSGHPLTCPTHLELILGNLWRVLITSVTVSLLPFHLSLPHDQVCVLNWFSCATALTSRHYFTPQLHSPPGHWSMLTILLLIRFMLPFPGRIWSPDTCVPSCHQFLHDHLTQFALLTFILPFKLQKLPAK